MSEKQDLIKQMLKMQSEFIKYEQSHGVPPVEYFAPAENHPLYNYKEKFAELSSKVVDLAHAEKNSKR